MIHLTDEQAVELSEFAELLFNDNDLATILQVDPRDFRIEMMKPQSKLYSVIKTARLKKEAEIRKSIMDMAVRSSTPAQTLAMKYLIKLRVDNV
jgi:hypothetical protein